MDILLAMLLGILQGITEWFPVSSSGHLVLAQTYLGAGASDAEWLFFDLVVHVASVIVVAIAFRKEIISLVKAFFSIFSSKRGKMPLGKFLRQVPDRLFAVMIIVGTVPTVIIGFVFRRWLEGLYSQPLMVGIGLIFTGLLLLLTVGLTGGRTAKNMRCSDAIAVGIMQGVAIMPGVSRSGSTITTGMVMGVERDTAARYAFLLAIPAILGALVLEVWNAPAFHSSFIIPLAIAFISTLIVGYAALKGLMWIVRKQKIYLFAPYCLALGSAVLVWILVLGN